MKTAISLPDPLYQDAEQIAHYMGIPRSQLFALALQEFINHHKRESITEKLNSIYNNDISNNSSIDLNIQELRNFTKNDTW